MRIFISWSGDLSLQLAEAIRNWLPSALQYVKPYFTPADVEKGAKWATEISKELANSSICVIVLTRENLKSSWIMFEAGAISSTIDKARVCPIIFDLEPTDIQGPLAQFQVTRFAREDFRKLFITINASAGEAKLSDATVEGVFNKWWPDLEQELNRILQGHLQKADAGAVRSERDLIEEILSLTRTIAADKPASKPPVPPIPYAATLYRQMLGTLQVVLDASLVMDDTTARGQILALRNDVTSRHLASELRNSLVSDIDKILNSLPIPEPKTKRKPKSDMDDEIPF